MSLSRLLRLFGALVVLATMLLVGRIATTEYQLVRASAASVEAIDQLRAGLLAAEMVSRERGPTNGALGGASPLPAELQQALAQARTRTDRAFDALHGVLSARAGDAMRVDAARRVAAAKLALATARSAVDEVVAQPKAERAPESIRSAVYGMVAIVPLLAPVTSSLANAARQNYPALADDVQVARLTAELREFAGLLGSHFTAALARQQPFSAEERRAIEQTRGRIAQLRFLIELRLSVPEQPRPIAQAWQTVQQRYFRDTGPLIDRMIAAGESDGRYGLDAAGFAALYVPDMNTIFEVRDTLLTQLRERASAEYARAVRMLGLVAAGSVLLLALLAAALSMVDRRVLSPLVQTARALKALANNDLDAPLPQPTANDEMAAVIRAARELQLQTRQRESLERERNSLIAQLREQSNTDFLTGLPNRRAFFDAAESVLAQARRHGFGVVIVILDVDRFKLLNDQWGHAVGDQALVAVARTLRSELRLGDLVGRFGGEEFVVLLSHCDPAHGVRLAERLREAVADLQLLLPASPQPLRLTASFGVADSGRHGLVLDQLLSEADAAMYRAKETGRNRVVLAEPKVDTGAGELTAV
ncbi:GGDEF domain-containing protein [Paracidovorax valerianellae]|uniref:diguanylate cyclase n=1 Tax=Paracidovorax valerianellae TaxID=187868 RepID=A0A1G6RF75_9BURK|nr:diguanylate cyclase [Paracidovorax valerianellae]MDA8445026.1 diguanylate cyclase [Paracidovorax valerianellae]SDD03033.1 diguanylate cyclase (GGDEF) domain-containing protein [Paracidovorax valerianellae]